MPLGRRGILTSVSPSCPDIGRVSRRMKALLVAAVVFAVVAACAGMGSIYYWIVNPGTSETFLYAGALLPIVAGIPLGLWAFVSEKRKRTLRSGR